MDGQQWEESEGEDETATEPGLTPAASSTDN